MTACPSCGSTNGYRFFVRVEMEGSWGEAAEATGWTTAPVTVECTACGKRIARERAQSVKLALGALLSGGVP